jgi:Ser/Thr protein kinase RdoA (MazF antagonist)
MSPPTDADARKVLRRFGLAAAPAQPLGNRGGFSGARIWRILTDGGDLCLKAWPPDGMTPARHREIVRLIRHARHSGLTIIPATADHIEYADRVWDLADWMAGTADFHAHPSATRLRAACGALARLHVAWSMLPSPPGPCPAVIRRMIAAREWLDATGPGSWRPVLAAADPVSPWAERGWSLIVNRIPDIPQLLKPWTFLPLPVQPCLCDVWHDHVLFTGDDVTGLIDFGAVKIDNVAVDLARLLGSMVGDDAVQFEAGLDAYAEIRTLSKLERALVPVLDRTGVVLGLANWLRRLFHDGGEFEDRVAVAGRMSELVMRAERWASVEATARRV